MNLILLVLVILLIVGAFPAVGIVNYGYAPSGIGLVLLIVLLLYVFGALH